MNKENALTGSDTLIGGTPGNFLVEDAVAASNSTLFFTTYQGEIYEVNTGSGSHSLAGNSGSANGLLGIITVPSAGFNIALDAPNGCPGGARLSIAGATPNRPVGVLFAPSTGNAVVPGGPCAGVQLGLSASFRIVSIQNADGNGNLIVSGNLPPASCGGYLQAVDGGTCTPSNVVQVQ